MFDHFFTHQFILVKLIIIVISTPIKVLDKGILPLELNSVAIQFFLDLENEDKMNACKLRSYPNKCCLYDNDTTDCNSVKLYGEYEDVLKPNDRKVYMFIYPTMAQLNQQGYCELSLDYHCKRRLNKSEEIRIPFDTRLYKKEKQHLLRNIKRLKTSHCATPDEDPLNNCGPVNCDLKYSGTKSFYNKKSNRCVETAVCIGDLEKKLPDIAYEPISNTCKDLDHFLTIADVYSINTGLGVVMVSNESTEDVKFVFQPNCSTISQNLLFLKDMLYGKVSTVNSGTKGYTLDFTDSCKNAMLSILSCILGVTFLLLACLCCAHKLIWFRKEWKTGHLKKRVKDLKSRINTKERINEEYESKVNQDVRDSLLKEVIVSALPLELRDSVVDICARVGDEIRWKKRFKTIHVGSQINLRQVDTSDTSTTSDLDTDEKERLLN